jgi:uncharacterized protein YcbK (DUF882 family)
VENLTEHFTLREARCKNKNRTAVPKKLIPNAKRQAENLEKLRTAIGDLPININSWYRTPAHNKKVGGHETSEHMEAIATDIWVFGISSLTLYYIIEDLIRSGVIEEGGLGVYYGFVHYDCRGYRSRWNNRT